MTTNDRQRQHTMTVSPWLGSAGAAALTSSMLGIGIALVITRAYPFAEPLVATRYLITNNQLITSRAETTGIY